jgi:hypothetical protein
VHSNFLEAEAVEQCAACGVPRKYPAEKLAHAFRDCGAPIIGDLALSAPKTAKATSRRSLPMLRIVTAY